MVFLSLKKRTRTKGYFLEEFTLRNGWYSGVLSMGMRKRTKKGATLMSSVAVMAFSHSVVVQSAAFA